MSETAGRCGPNGDDLYCARYWEMSAERDAARDELAKLREQLEATKTVLQETSRESSQRGDESAKLRELVIEILCTYAGDTGSPGVLTSLASPGQHDRWRERAGLRRLRDPKTPGAQPGQQETNQEGNQ